MADLQELMEKAKEGCYKQVSLNYFDQTQPITKEDVDNVFKYVHNYYMFSTPNISKNEYKLLLIKIKTRVEDFFERTWASSIHEMTPIEILVKIFGQEQVDKAIEKYGETNPITDTILEEEHIPKLKVIPDGTLDEVDGGSRSRKRKNKSMKRKNKSMKRKNKSMKRKMSKRSIAVN